MPICLIGNLYRIVSKILAGRLKNVTRRIIFRKQSDFIPNCNMLNMVLVINELVDFVRRNKKHLFLFKVDFERAFNSVSWDYLLFVIKKVNFGNRWIKWIQARVRSSSFYVLVNESLTMDFQGKRDLHQGDPLSLFLFIIIV